VVLPGRLRPGRDIDDRPETVRERDGRLVAKRRPGGGNVCDAAVDIPGPSVDVSDVRVRIEDVDDGPRQLVYAGLRTGADVERASGGVALCGKEVRTDDVVNVDEITRLCPVAVDGECLLSACL
jgi:hypothetical protein